MKVIVPNRQDSAGVLDWIYGDPRVSATMLEAGVVGLGTYFELDVFGAGSNVDDLLSFNWNGTPPVRAVCLSEGEPYPHDDVHDEAQESPASQEEPVDLLVFGKR